MNHRVYKDLHKRFAWLPVKTESGKRRWLCPVWCVITAHWVEIGYWKVERFYTQDEAIILALKQDT